MYGNGVFLTFAVLFVIAYARPDGYGVKGGNHRESIANAFASAHATANAVAGGLGIAKSSATATANANSSGGGGTSSADATANASTDGGNIGKVIGENANRNANRLIDSDDLHQSNDRGKVTENEWISHVDGTTRTNHPIVNAEHAGSDGNNENFGWTGEGHDHRRCGGIPEGVKGHGSVTRCGDKTPCKGNKPDVFDPFSRKPENFGLSADSQHSIGNDGVYGGNSPRPGADITHSGSPCAAGDFKCLESKPSVSNPYPTYDKNTHLSADGSSNSAGIDGGYGENSQRPGTGIIQTGSPCTAGDSKCFAHKPILDNTGHPGSSSGKIPDTANPFLNGGIDGGYGGNSPRPGTDTSHSGSPCAAGDSKCSVHKPSVPNPYPTYDKNPNLSAGSSSSAGIDGGYPGTSSKPGNVGSPCAPGDPKCFAQKPNSGNAGHPGSSSGKIPDTANPFLNGGIDGGYGGNTPRPGTGTSHSGSPCAAGDSTCSVHKPSVPNPYPTYDKNPNLSAGSSSSAGIDGGYPGTSSKPGNVGGPCAPGDSKCFAHKPISDNAGHPGSSSGKIPDTANPFLNGGIDGGYGGNSPRPETGTSHSGSPCAAGDSTCSVHKPSVSNPYPTYDKNPDLSAGSSSSAGIDGGYGGNSPRPGTGTSHSGSPCAAGDSKCSVHKPSVPNPYPTYDKNPNLSAGSSSSAGIDGGYPGTSSKPGNVGGPCAPGDSKCFAHKPISGNAGHPGSSSGKIPDTANPFLNGGIDGGYGGNSPRPGTGPSHSGSPCAAGDSTCSVHKPSVSNPYPTYDKNPDLSAGSSSSAGIDGSYGGTSSKPGGVGSPCAHGDSKCTIPKPGNFGSPCAPGDSKCFASKPSVTNPYPTYEKNPDISTGSSGSAGIDGGYGGNGPKPGTDVIHTGISCAPGDPKCFPHKPISDNTGHHGPSSGKAPGTSNPFLNGQIDLSGIKSTSHSGHSKPNPSNPFLSGEIDLSGIKHPVNSGGRPDSKPNPSNPFLNPHSQIGPTTSTYHPGVTGGPQNHGNIPNAGAHTHTNGPQTTSCHGPVPCSPNKLSGSSNYPLSTNNGPKVEDNRNPGWDHRPTTFPGNQPGESNPFLVDTHLTKPGSHGTSSLTPGNGQSGQNPLPGHGDKPKISEGCPSFSTGCTGHKASGNNDDQDSVIQGHGNAGTFSSEDWGVKGHQSGVKGGSGHLGQPIKLQGNSGLGENRHPGDEIKGSAWSNANASASASAHSNAYASSSSFIDGGQASANAKSEASSSLGNPASSNAWSSSSASASASAFASSSAQSWTAPVLPQVPAE